MRSDLPCAHNAGVGAGEADGSSARGIDRCDEAGVHCAGEHLDDDAERVGVGDAQTVNLPLGDAGTRQRCVDLAAAAMHDDQRRRRRGNDRGNAPSREGCSSSSPPSFRTSGVIGAAPAARRSRRRR